MDWKEALKKLWNYIWKSNSIGSYVLNFLLAFIIIKYIFFPVSGFVLQNDFPIVAIVSGSMEHRVVNGFVCGELQDVTFDRLSFDEWWDECGPYYETNYNLTKETFKSFPFSHGLNAGDVMILYGKQPEYIEQGDVLIFIPEDRAFFEQKGPVIHRVVEIQVGEEGFVFRTKGDHNARSFDGFENAIPEEDIIGVGVFRIPYIGYVKILLNQVFLAVAQR